MYSRFIASLNIVEELISTALATPNAGKANHLLMELKQHQAEFSEQEKTAFKKQLEQRLAQCDKEMTLKLYKFLLGGMALGLSTTLFLKCLMAYDPATAVTHFLSNLFLSTLIGVPAGISIAALVDPTVGEELKATKELNNKLSEKEQEIMPEKDEIKEDALVASSSIRKRKTC